MDFSLLPALTAGFLATILMTLATELASLRGATSMPSTPLLIGLLVSGDHDLAMAVGSVFHYVVVGTVINGVIYALVFSLAGTGVILAALAGMIHGALVGASLGWLRRFHPRVVDRAASENGDVISDDRGEIVVSDPGVFGVGWGDMTPVVVVGSYVIYSLVFLFVYSLAI